MHKKSRKKDWKIEEEKKQQEQVIYGVDIT